MTFREIVFQTRYSVNLETKIPRDDTTNLQVYSRRKTDKMVEGRWEKVTMENLLNTSMKNSLDIRWKNIFALTKKFCLILKLDAQGFRDITVREK